jgi:hypothetical protein
MTAAVARRVTMTAAVLPKTPSSPHRLSCLTARCYCAARAASAAFNRSAAVGLAFDIIGSFAWAVSIALGSLTARGTVALISVER